MINLLPPEIKQARRYGRINAVLLSWILLCMIGIAGLGLVSVGGYFYMTSVENATKAEKQDYEKQIAQQNFTETTKAYEKFATNVQMVSKVLQKQVLFSAILTKAGSVLPDGVILKTLELSEKDNALTLDFDLPDTNTAPILQKNLQDPTNQLFEKADLLTLQCGGIKGPTDTVAKSSCAAQMRVLLGANSRLLLYQPAPTKAATGSAQK